MTETTSYCCPGCGGQIRSTRADGRQLDCANCSQQFRLVQDKAGGWAGLVPVKAAAESEPLRLPQGSIRAIATLVTAGCSWGIMIAGGLVPDYAMDLLLTIIGYYFGFRRKARGAGGPVFDASARAPEPLGLPGGTIRAMLIVGFGVSAWLLYSRGQIGSSAYVEFFLILAGLVAGYFFSRLFAGTMASRAGRLVNHAKGLIVLVATVQLAMLLWSANPGAHPHWGLALACIISFYFGSRS